MFMNWASVLKFSSGKSNRILFSFCLSEAKTSRKKKIASSRTILTNNIKNIPLNSKIRCVLENKICCAFTSCRVRVCTSSSVGSSRWPPRLPRPLRKSSRCCAPGSASACRRSAAASCRPCRTGTSPSSPSTFGGPVPVSLQKTKTKYLVEEYSRKTF